MALTLIIPDLANNPQTPYKFYSYGLPTYNVFIALVDSVIILIIVAVIAYLVAGQVGKKIGE